MSEIATAKTQFKTALVAAGLKVSEFVPEKVTPPIVIIDNGSPYLSPASVGKEYILNLELKLVASTATNIKRQAQLDQLIEDTINALPRYSTLRSVSQPYSLVTNSAEYFAASVEVEVQITI